MSENPTVYEVDGESYEIRTPKNSVEFGAIYNPTMRIELSRTAMQIADENGIPIERWFALDYPNDYGYSLRSANLDKIELPAGGEARIPTGVMLQGIDGIMPALFPRSGYGARGLVLGNIVGCIDFGFTGELLLHLWYRKAAGTVPPITINPGAKIAQCMFLPALRPRILIGEIDRDTARGSGGFGSTGDR